MAGAPARVRPAARGLGILKGFAALHGLSRALARRLLFWRPMPRERRHALTGPIELWRMKRQFQIDFLRSRGLEPRHTLFDLGCGTLRGGLPLIDYLGEGHYVGFDPRARAVREAKRELKAAGLERRRPLLLQAERVSELNLARRFDYIWAFSVLIHLDDEILCESLDFVASHLAPEGVFYANVNLGERPNGAWQGFPVVWRSFDFYRDAAAQAGLEIADEGVLSDLGHRSGIAAQDAQHMLRLRHPQGAQARPSTSIRTREQTSTRTVS